jgi:hypothetical protein
MKAFSWLLLGGAVVVGLIVIHNYVKMGGIKGAEDMFIRDLRVQGHPLTPAQQHAAGQIAHGYY